MSTITTTRKTAPSERIEIEACIKRFENTLATLRQSDVKEVRLMFGTMAHTIICDAVMPIAGIKKAYTQAVKARIIELKYELLETIDKE
jgi:hypothetical protein